jgi:hypothetical protein
MTYDEDVLGAIVAAGVKCGELRPEHAGDFRSDSPVRAYIDALLMELQEVGFDYELHTSSEAWAEAVDEETARKDPTPTIYSVEFREGGGVQHFVEVETRWTDPGEIEVLAAQRLPQEVLARVEYTEVVVVE